MKKNEKTNSKANNTTTNNVVLSTITFAAAKEFKTNQNLSFSATIKNLGAPYAPANKPFSTDILKQYGIAADSSINCFRAILIDEAGQYKIYRALDKYTQKKGIAQKALTAFCSFREKIDYNELSFETHNAIQNLYQCITNDVAEENARIELEKKEREQKKENARIERITKGIESEDAAAAKIEELKKQIAALQNMQF